MEDSRVRVYVDGSDIGTVSRANVGIPEAKDKGIFVNTDIDLFDLTADLERRMHEEMGGKCRFMLTLEFPDGRKFHGTDVGPKEMVSGKRHVVRESRKLDRVDRA